MITQFYLYILANNNLKRNFKKNSISIMSTLIKYFAMDVMRMIRLAHWKLYKIAEKYPKYMYRYSIAMERLKLAIPWNASSIWNEDSIWITKGWKVAAKPQKMPGFLASRGEEFNPGPVTKLDGSEVLCYKVLLNYKRDRESCWHRHQKGEERVPPASL